MQTIPRMMRNGFTLISPPSLDGRVVWFATLCRQGIPDVPEIVVPTLENIYFRSHPQPGSGLEMFVPLDRSRIRRLVCHLAGRYEHAGLNVHVIFYTHSLFRCVQDRVCDLLVRFRAQSDPVPHPPFPGVGALMNLVDLARPAQKVLFAYT